MAEKFLPGDLVRLKPDGALMIVEGYETPLRPGGEENEGTVICRVPIPEGSPLKSNTHLYAEHLLERIEKP